jgi:hypothetical protein
MSEQHRIMQEIKMDDSLIAHDMYQQRLDALNNGEAIVSDAAKLEILAEDAHHKAQAIREAMPEDIDPIYEQFIDNHPDGVYPNED